MNNDLALPTFTLHLHGKLRKLVGSSEITVPGYSIRDAFRGLVSQIGHELDTFIRENKFQLYHDKYDKNNYEDFTETDLDTIYSGNTVIHVYNYIKGSGRAGRIIAGAVLVVVGVIVTGWAAPVGNALISAGIGLILQGLFMPKTNSDDGDQEKSFMFNGATNTNRQGQSPALVYGQFRVGSIVAATGIDTAQLSTWTVPGSGGTANDQIWWDRVVENNAL